MLTTLITFSGYPQSSSLRALDPQLKDYVYPYSVSFLPLHIQGQTLQMAYMDVQPTSYNGKNVVLLHGKNFNGAYWRTTIEALIKEGYRVIVPDQIGFGKSSKPESFQYSFHQLAANTKAVLDTLRIKKATIVGHSMGGMLATRFALMYPDITEKLVLENPIGLEDYKVVVPYTPVSANYQNELKATGLYNELGKKTQRKIPGSVLVELENVGHMPHIEVFDRFIGPLKSFLADKSIK